MQKVRSSRTRMPLKKRPNEINEGSEGKAAWRIWRKWIDMKKFLESGASEWVWIGLESLTRVNEYDEALWIWHVWMNMMRLCVSDSG
jgi:hypothetical protein